MSGWWWFFVSVGVLWFAVGILLIRDAIRAEEARLEGYRDWIEGRRLP